MSINIWISLNLPVIGYLSCVSMFSCSSSSNWHFKWSSKFDQGKEQNERWASCGAEEALAVGTLKKVQRATQLILEMMSSCCFCLAGLLCCKVFVALFKLIRMQQANELLHAKAGQTMRSSIYDKVERGRRIERERETCNTADRGLQ